MKIWNKKPSLCSVPPGFCKWCIVRRLRQISQSRKENVSLINNRATWNASFSLFHWRFSLNLNPALYSNFDNMLLKQYKMIQVQIKNKLLRKKVQIWARPGEKCAAVNCASCFAKSQKFQTHSDVQCSRCLPKGMFEVLSFKKHCKTLTEWKKYLSARV